MDKKRAIFNFSLALAMLFAILFQSIHSVEHLVEQLSTAHCEHQPTESKTQITHQHHDLDHCPICDFTFSSFVASELYGINFSNSIVDVAYFSYAFEIPFFYPGSLNSDRGPPTSNC